MSSRLLACFLTVSALLNPVVEVQHARGVDQAIGYLQRQNERRAARTLWYYDVLGFGARDAERAQRAVDLHLA